MKFFILTIDHKYNINIQLTHFNNLYMSIIMEPTYHYNNNPLKARITHFDGITGNGKRGYNLTGDWLGLGEGPELGFFAKVKRNKCAKCGKYKKSFKKTKWSPISFPKSTITSGNSVYESTVIGVYASPELKGINGYILS